MLDSVVAPSGWEGRGLKPSLERVADRVTGRSFRLGGAWIETAKS